MNGNAALVLGGPVLLGVLLAIVLGTATLAVRVRGGVVIGSAATIVVWAGAMTIVGYWAQAHL